MWRTYLTPFLDSGNYGTEIEITDDVEIDSIGTIDNNLDNTDYNIGIYRSSNFSITIRNDSGIYSDVGQPNSIFRHKRSGSKLRFTWSHNSARLKCGFVPCGNSVLTQEITVFNGLLDDSSLTLDLVNQELSFNTLGLDSFLGQQQVNWAAVGSNQSFIDVAFSGVSGVLTATTISPHGLINGNPVQFTTTGSLPTGISALTTYYVFKTSTTTYNLAKNYADSLTGTSLISYSTTGSACFQSFPFGYYISHLINLILQWSTTLSGLFGVPVTYDSANISVGIDSIIDDATGVQNKTVLAALQDLLLLSNSVMYFINGSIYVRPRTPTSNVFNMFGQASTSGPENIQDVQNLTSGLNRIFNTFNWSSFSKVVSDTTSIALWGTQQKDLAYSYFTNPTTQANIAGALLTSFAAPKKEMDLFVPIDHKTIGIFLNDNITMDLPPVPIPNGSPFPICGAALCGSAFLPASYFGFVEYPSNLYTVIGTSVDPSTDLICLTLRAQ